jgi:UPF0716 protein FxsA
MSSLLLIIIGFPILEITIMIKIGQNIGTLNTIILIFLTATIGIYYARIEGLNTIKSGITNLYQNKTPIYEMLSGASIAVAAVLLILPGFISDTLGFILLFPPTRRVLINRWIGNKFVKKEKEEVLEAEIVEKKEKDEL